MPGLKGDEFGWHSKVFGTNTAKKSPCKDGVGKGDNWILTPSIPWVRGVHGLPAVDRDGAILAKLLLGLVHLANEVDETFS